VALPYKRNTATNNPNTATKTAKGGASRQVNGTGAAKGKKRSGVVLLRRG
jgi:hypothetical protein